MYSIATPWVIDDKFKPNTGSLHRISYVANSGKPFPLITSQPEEVTADVSQEAIARAAAKGNRHCIFSGCNVEAVRLAPPGRRSPSM